MKTIALFALLLVVGLPVTVTAQENHHLFPGSGQVSVSGSTGIPYVAIGEVAYGFSDDVAVGIIGGTTPIVIGYGLRPRVRLYDASEGTGSLYVNAPLIYYPNLGEDEPEPWALVWPTLNYEWGESTRYWVKGGAVAVSCLQELIYGEHSHSPAGEGVDHSAHSAEEHASHLAEGNGEEDMFGWWQTAGGGISVQLSDRAVFHAEASLVLDGLSVPTESEWIGGLPVITTIAVTFNL